MNFNYSFGIESPGAPTPDMDVYYHQKAPRIQARGNLTLLEYIDLIEYLWKKGYPEIIYQPMGAKKTWDPERGYIVWELESRVPKENNVKPRHQQVYDHPEDSNRKISIWTQSFNNLIGFTALHQNPRTAEEIIEQFEEFMIEATPILKELGIEELLYSRRISDRTEKRFGEDLSARTVLYMATTQRVIPVEQHKLNEIVGELKVFIESDFQEE